MMIQEFNLKDSSNALRKEKAASDESIWRLKGKNSNSISQFRRGKASEI